MKDDQAFREPRIADDMRAEQSLWNALGELDSDGSQWEPPSRARADFYRQLNRSNRPRHPAWILPLALAATLVIGVGIGRELAPDQTSQLDVQSEIAALRQDLAITLLDHSSVHARLRGTDAARQLGPNEQVSAVLLNRVLADPSASVRLAAADVLSHHQKQPADLDHVLTALENSADPLIQRALAELILRQGGTRALTQLRDLARNGDLDPTISGWILTAIDGASA